MLSSLSIEDTGEPGEEGQKVTETSVEFIEDKNKKREFIHKKGVTFGSIRLLDAHHASNDSNRLYLRALWQFFFRLFFRFVFTDNDLSDVRSNWIFVLFFVSLISLSHLNTFCGCAATNSCMHQHQMIGSATLCVCLRRTPDTDASSHCGRTKGFENEEKKHTFDHIK